MLEYTGGIGRYTIRPIAGSNPACVIIFKMFTLNDEIELLEREIKERTHKRFLDEIFLNALRESLSKLLKRKKDNEDAKKRIDESQRNIKGVIEKIKSQEQ